MRCFSDFELPLITELEMSPTLFKIEMPNLQLEQLKVFEKLEAGLPFINATSFKNDVHFQYAYLTPVQRWFPYREGYSTRLVNAFIKELNISGVVFDPFSGSGTTLLSARHANLKSYGIDVNPISTLVAKVENEVYDNKSIEVLKREIKAVVSLLHSDEVFETPFHLAYKVFNYDILQALLQFKSHIKRIRNLKVRNIFTIAWLSIIEAVSNIKKEGNGIKYKNRKRTKNGYVNIDRNDWEKSVFPENKFNFVKNKLVKNLKTILSDIEEKYGSNKKQPIIFNGSCLEFDKMFSDEIEFTFFSPPYCNCFDYFEIHKVELWLGDYVRSQKELRQLRNIGFRSNTNSLSHKPIAYKNENLEALITLFDINKLWSKKIPNVVRGYFDDMHTLLCKLYQQTVKGGYVGIVIGNSAYTGVIIPSDVLIANIAKAIGFEVENVFVTRHLTTSSQQKQKLEYLKKHLRESIVLLKK